MEEITRNNWMSCYYKSSKLFASISIGMDYSSNDAMDYFITISDHDNKEVLQRKFENLEEALIQINNDYSNWEFTDSTIPQKSSGCDDCIK
ncbi:MAG: hypothetical protein HOJ35_01025 [Bdellovibrionales bacterium]|jgi:hypothetical protein|nr:hypothetical protein [Bdellovibrionales bacterium]